MVGSGDANHTVEEIIIDRLDKMLALMRESRQLARNNNDRLPALAKQIDQLVEGLERK
jgi:hypothetical protein